MELYEMTFKQYREHLLETNKYKKSYLAKPELWEKYLEDHKKQWVELLLERAKIEALKTTVIQSYIRTFSGLALYGTFRGIYYTGVKDYKIPKSIRDLRLMKESF